MRELKESVLRDGHPWNTWHKPRHVPVGQDEPSPEGVSSWISFQDLRGASHLGRMFALHSPQNTFFRYDENCPNADDVTGTAVVFGLGFNGFTYLMSEAHEHKLFEARWGPSPHKDFRQNTDHIYVPTLGGVLRPPENCDYAIVARIVPEQQDSSRPHYFFVCAGRTASGTAAAGWFLANKWRRIQTLYERSPQLDFRKDSLLIVVRHPYDAFRPADTDSSTNIARIGDRLGVVAVRPNKEMIQLADEEVMACFPGL